MAVPTGDRASERFLPTLGGFHLIRPIPAILAVGHANVT